MRLEAIDTHLVVALHALLQEQNVTHAARRVGLTQPSMSHALAKLRAHFDDPLLVQTGRSMTLTERARGLVAPVATSIESLQRVFSHAPDFDPRRAARTFRIAASDNVALYVLPQLVAMLATEAPQIDLRCSSIGTDWADRLRRGEIDLKLGLAEPPEIGLCTKPLLREHLVCVVRRGHAATRGRLTAARYASFDHVLVSPRGGDVGAIDRALAARRMKRRIVMTVPHFLVAPFVVARSDLVLTVSARVAKALAPRLDLVTLACPFRGASYGLGQVWASSTDGDEAHRWLRRAVERAATDERA